MPWGKIPTALAGAAFKQWVSLKLCHVLKRGHCYGPLTFNSYCWHRHLMIIILFWVLERNGNSSLWWWSTTIMKGIRLELHSHNMVIVRLIIDTDWLTGSVRVFTLSVSLILISRLKSSDPFTVGFTWIGGLGAAFDGVLNPSIAWLFVIASSNTTAQLKC